MSAMFSFCYERAFFSYKAGKFVFFTTFIVMFLLMFQYLASFYMTT